MAQKNVYIRGADTPVWEAAERVAKRNRTNVSQVVMTALREYLPRAAAEPVEEIEWSEIAAGPRAA